MIAHTAKVMPILSSVLVLIGFFLTSCVGINLRDIPRGLRHPRDVPSVDPSTLGRKTLYALASLKYLYNAIANVVVQSLCSEVNSILLAPDPAPYSFVASLLHFEELDLVPIFRIQLRIPRRQHGSYFIFPVK